MTIQAVKCDNRSGDRNHPYGFVYFNDDTRCVYAKGLGEFDGVSLGTGGWTPITMTHVREAQAFLAKEYGDDWNTRP